MGRMEVIKRSDTMKGKQAIGGLCGFIVVGVVLNAFAPIEQWLMLNFGLSGADATSITYLILGFFGIVFVMVVWRAVQNG